jgi:PAS domain S-box-containing protein
MVLIDTEGKVLLSNIVGAQRLGKTAPEFVGTCLYEHFPPDVAQNRKEHYDRVIATGEPVYFQDIRAGRFFESYCHAVFNEEENVSGVAIFAHETTSRKQAEAELEESEEKFRLIFEKSYDPILMLDGGIFIDCNEAALKILHCTGKDQIIGLRPSDISPDKQPDGRLSSEKADELIGAALKQGFSHFEWKHHTIDGEEFWVEVSLTVIPIQGKRIMHALWKDITDSIYAREKIIESEQSLYGILSASPNGIGKVRDRVFAWVNDAMCRITGYTFNELENASTRILYRSDEEYERTGEILYGEGRVDTVIVRKDGTVCNVLIQISPTSSYSYIFTFTDITDRKKAEETLKWKTALLEGQMNTSIDGILVVDENGKRLLTNRRINELWNVPQHILDDEDDSALLAHVVGLTRYPDKFLEKVIYLYDHPSEISRDEIEFTNGLILDRYSSPVLGENGQYYGRIWTFRDITDRKLAEEKIKSLLSEKELLLREVHHRIKNNMSVITGMLMLQAETLKEPSAVDALNDATSRVRSMMVLYDKLYRSADFKSISIKEYLTSLIHEIIGNFPGRMSINVETQIDDCILEARTLSPMGIILNELLTNAMKHAFTDKEKGVIKVSLSIKNNQATLIVQDNGAGIPESIDTENSIGFGLQLVNILTEQLEGTMRIEREEGTRFVMEFEV